MTLLERFQTYEYPAPVHGDRPSLKLTAGDALALVLQWRDECFAPGNDKVWGKGQWVRCDQCLDMTGLPSYHHRSLHDTESTGGQED